MSVTGDLNIASVGELLVKRGSLFICMEESTQRAHYLYSVSMNGKLKNGFHIHMVHSYYIYRMAATSRNSAQG